MITTPSPPGGVKHVAYNFGCVKMQVLENLIFEHNYRSKIPPSDKTVVKIVSYMFDPDVFLLSLYALQNCKLHV